MKQCDGVTKSARLCKVKPTTVVELGDGTRRHYCTAHANGAGIMKMLLPFPWEIKRVFRSI